MFRIALGIEYEGRSYFGWQRQSNKSSVQAQCESAIARIANEPIKLFCAGRTDAGVHACGQVVHFDTHAHRSNRAWVQGVNTYLPPDIRVGWCHSVESHFDARRSARARRYCYVIANDSMPSGIMHSKTTWVRSPLNEELMHQGAQYLLGNHDFSSFRAAHCQAKSPSRTIQAIQVFRKSSYVLLDVTADAFLYHMVRNIVGSLIQVGLQKQPQEWISSVLNKKDRRFASITAPPQGLYLVAIQYPQEFGLPEKVATPWFFP